MSVRDSNGKATFTDNLLPIVGEEGISITETASQVSISVDIPSLVEDTAPSKEDYIIIHGEVNDTKRKILLANLSNLGKVGAQVDIYPTPGRNFPWTKPANTKMIEVILFGAGGSGGTGCIRGSATDRSGGGGGGGGGLFQVILPADMFEGTGTVSVGRGGSPTYTTQSSSEIGRAGAAGESTAFLALKTRLYLSGTGGGAGGGGTIAGNSGGAGGAVLSGISGGAGGGTTDGPPHVATAGGSTQGAPAGGGGGGGWNSTESALQGGASGGVSLTSTMAAATGGSTEGQNGQNGQDNLFFGGGGGGGGANSPTTGVNGGNGGNGGWPGGGGGGGGSATYTSGSLTAAGNGGAGGDGLAIIISYF